MAKRKRNKSKATSEAALESLVFGDISNAGGEDLSRNEIEGKLLLEVAFETQFQTM